MIVSLILPSAVTLVGLFLIIRLKAFFILHPKRTLDSFLLGLENKNSRRALTLALAGTLGVGNIFGVSAGIMLGGAGSVFWLLLSSVFSSVIKYSEAVLCYDKRTGKHGGMHRVIDSLYPRSRGWVSWIYAALCLLLALFMGAGIQSLAVYGIFGRGFGKFAPILLIAFVIFVIFGCFGGVGKIERITAFVIPLTTVIYILLGILILIINFHSLGDVINNIISSAFTPSAAAGGAFSFLTSRALYEGFARGILSNEAGIGTSSMSHTRGEFPNAHTAGLFAMCEVFFDTVILCTLTALVILSSPESLSDAASPMELISGAFELTLGEYSVYVLAVLVLLFAYSTVVCWYYYGEECREYLFSEKGKRAYSGLFFSLCLFSIFLDESTLLFITDNIILLMAIITLTVLTLFSKRISFLKENTRER